MKKVIRIIAVLFAIITTFAVAGCKPTAPLVVKESDTYIVINASSDQMQISENTTLVEYMNSLKNDGQLSFEINNGMIIGINGIENPSDWSSCWMLYTDDESSANIMWGEIEYKGKIYGSAISGAETLKIKDGCTYIWIFQTF